MKKARHLAGFSLVEKMGLEPTTFALRMWGGRCRRVVARVGKGGLVGFS